VAHLAAAPLPEPVAAPPRPTPAVASVVSVPVAPATTRANPILSTSTCAGVPSLPFARGSGAEVSGADADHANQAAEATMLRPGTAGDEELARRLQNEEQRLSLSPSARARTRSTSERRSVRSDAAEDAMAKDDGPGRSGGPRRSTRDRVQRESEAVTPTLRGDTSKAGDASSHTENVDVQAQRGAAAGQRVGGAEEPRGTKRGGLRCADSGAGADEAATNLPAAGAAPVLPPLAARCESAPGAETATGEDAAEEEDDKCAICGIEESFETNQIVFCEACNVGVHQECYGVAKVPEGDWFCESCSAAAEESSSSSRRRPSKAHVRAAGASRAGASAARVAVSERSCPLCPMVTGAFKRTHGDSDGGWAHACCVSFHEGPGYVDDKRMRGAAGFDRVSQARRKLRCSICRGESDKRHGAKLQCAFGQCRTAFHVSCGVNAGFYVDVESLSLYCKVHSAKMRAADEAQGSGVEADDGEEKHEDEQPSSTAKRARR
jgi:hypothetical protein